MIMLSEPIGNIATDYIKKLEKENAEYQKGMISDAMIIKDADNKIIELEKENAALKAKCNHCYEAMAEKSNKAMTELMVDNSKVSEENRLLKAKLSANRFIYNTNERHKYQDKILELEEKLKTEIMTISDCVGEWKKIIAGLEKANNELKEEVAAPEEKISILEVKAVARNGRIMDLEQQLADIKYLDRQEVERLVAQVDTTNYGRTIINLDRIVTAICNLVIKKEEI